MNDLPARQLAGAYILDWVAGDPEGFPHPVRFMGLAIDRGSTLLLPRFSSPKAQFAAGGSLTALVVAGSWFVGRLLTKRLGGGFAVLLGWTTLASKSLLASSARVLTLVEAGDLPGARTALADIVGRDTADLPENEIVRAVIETVGEGLCDAVIAPLLYLAAGGVPLALAFKAVSTCDSMIGHIEPPYTYFGRIAARLDDGANFLPARCTALLLCCLAPIVGCDVRQAFSVWMRDRNRHTSPNAGQSEAAMAGALSVRLGGLNSYNGVPSPKPILNPLGRTPEPQDAWRAMRLAAAVSAVTFILLLLRASRKTRA